MAYAFNIFTGTFDIVSTTTAAVTTGTFQFIDGTYMTFIDGVDADYIT